MERKVGVLKKIIGVMAAYAASLFLADQSRTVVIGKGNHAISLIDENGDGKADIALKRVPFGAVPGGLHAGSIPTDAEQQYFASH